MKVEYHPSTVADLNNAVDYYESQRLGLGADCRAEAYQTIKRILESPSGIRRFTKTFVVALFAGFHSRSCIASSGMNGSEYL